jgi:hypothetical protein
MMMNERDNEADPFDAFRPDFVPKPELPTYSKSGIDLTMVRWMLSLTYKQRLDTLQNMADLAAKVKYVTSPSVPEDISDSTET